MCPPPLERHRTAWHDGGMASLDFDTLNSTIRYLMFSVFQVREGGLGEDRDGAADELTEQEPCHRERRQKGVAGDVAPEQP